MSDRDSTQAAAYGGKNVVVKQPLDVVPKQDEWLLLAFVDREDQEQFRVWWEQEGQRVFKSWKRR